MTEEGARPTVGDYDFDQAFEYENAYFATAPVNRISKFATHLELFRRVSGLPGEIVECGVFKGNSLFRFIKFRALFENAFSRKVIGFDTFGAFPEGGFEADRAFRDRFIAEAGDRGISVPAFRSILDRLGLDQNVHLVEGDILDTVPAYAQAHPQLRVALLHIDVDLHEPTKVALETFFPAVVRGGIVILDDYGAFPGANAAIEEYFKDRPERVQKLPYTNAISYVEKLT